MKLYGQTLTEIFKKLPWQYQGVVIISIGFLVMVITYAPATFYSVLNRTADPSPITLTSKPNLLNSTFDPSVASAPNDNLVVMAFTASYEGSPVRNVRLATSGSGACQIWGFNSQGVEGKTDALLAPDALSVFREGMWRIETPSLVYDPDDPGKEWKLFAYKYFWSPQDTANNALKIAKHYGIVVYKYASDPLREWSTEQWLFSPAPNYPPPPYQDMVKHHLNTMHPSLQDVTSYARPSVVYQDKHLLMSLSAMTDQTTPNRTVLFASADHGTTWHYLGAPIVETDAAKLGDYTKFAGATLVQYEGDTYLAGVFGDDTTRAKRTFFFTFDDINRGTVHREGDNTPIAVRDIGSTQETTGPLGGGFVTYTDKCDSGLFSAEQNPETGTFDIFRTYKLPVGKD